MLISLNYKAGTFISQCCFFTCFALRCGVFFHLSACFSDWLKKHLLSWAGCFVLLSNSHKKLIKLLTWCPSCFLAQEGSRPLSFLGNQQESSCYCSKVFKFCWFCTAQYLAMVAILFSDAYAFHTNGKRRFYLLLSLGRL